MAGTRTGAAALAAAVLAGLAVSGCGSVVGAGNRIVVEVRADPDLNSEGGTAQPVMFRTLGMKTQVAAGDLVQWDAPKLASVGTLLGGDSNWVWPGKTAVLPPYTLKEAGEFRYLALIVSFPKPRATVVELDGKARDGYEFDSGEHRLTFSLGKSTITQGKSTAAPEKPAAKP